MSAPNFRISIAAPLHNFTRRCGVIFAFILLVSLLSGNLCVAQDSTGYVVGYYKVTKKNQTARDLAKQLKVDPQIIVRLNAYINSYQVLPFGEKVKIPLNTSGKKVPYNPNTRQKQTNNSGDKVVSIVIPEQKISKEELEVQKNRLLLIDATLELNEALLQGVHASLDTLNTQEKSVVDEKNMAATLKHMQRERDRAVLKPYLLHIKDSLQNEITNLKKQQVGIESVFSEAELREIRGETAIEPVEDSVPAVESVKEEKPVAIEEKPVANVQSSEKPQVKHQIQPLPDKPIKDEHHWGSAKALPPLDNSMWPVTMGLAQPEEAKQIVTTDTGAYKAHKALKIESPKDTVVAVKSDTIGQLRAEVYVTRAKKALNEKKFAIAEELLQKAIDINGDYFEAWLTLADVHNLTGLVEKAFNEYKICENLNETNPKLYAKLGSVAEKLKLKPEALVYYEKAIKLDSTTIPALMGRASILSDQKQYAKAIDDYDRVLKLNLSYHEAYKWRGIDEYYLKNYSTAIDDLTRHLIFKEKDAQALYFRGLSKMANKQRTEGCEDLTMAAHLGSKSAQQAIERSCNSNK